MLHKKNSSTKSSAFTPAINALRPGIVVLTAFLVLACTSFDYTAFKESRPRSILVMPPVNESVDIEAPATYISSSTLPLAESGYYVIPVVLSDTMFKENGIIAPEEAWAIDYSRLHEIYGADAALYITITRFGAQFMIIDSSVRAEAFARLVDLRTGVEIWSGKAFAEGSNNVRSGGGGLLGMLITATVNQAINSLSDKSHQVGRTATRTLLSADSRNGILYGPYHSKYMTD